MSCTPFVSFRYRLWDTRCFLPYSAPVKHKGLSNNHAVARWSDGSVSEAIRRDPHRILFCEGDLIGKTRDQIRSLDSSREREGLQS